MAGLGRPIIALRLYQDTRRRSQVSAKYPRNFVALGARLTLAALGRDSPYQWFAGFDQANLGAGDTGTG